MVQLVGQIHVNLMRIDQTFGLLPEGIFLSGADVADLHDGWRSVDACALLENRNEELA